MENPRREFSLEAHIPVRRGLASIAASLVLAAIAGLSLDRFSPGRFPTGVLLGFLVMVAVGSLCSLFLARRAREHVVVTPQGIVRTRRLLLERTRTYDARLISRIRYERSWNRFFEQSVGASGTVDFQYGDSGFARLAIARNDDEGRQLAGEIDDLLGRPAEPEDFFSRT